MVGFKMNHTPPKPQKLATLQTFSKLFMKLPALSSTTKNTIPTIPTMSLLANSQGSSLSRGSFEDLSSTVRQDHRQMTRKETLTKKRNTIIFAKHWQNSPDPALLPVWEHYRKSSTVNQYDNPWSQWVEYSQTAGSKPIPANLFLFPTWLTVACPTETR